MLVKRKGKVSRVSSTTYSSIVYKTKSASHVVLSSEDPTTPLLSKDTESMSTTQSTDNITTPPRPLVNNLSNAAVTLETFTLFPKLPDEMRLKIWFHSLPGPKFIEIQWIQKVAWACCFSSQAVPSGLLRANQESRKEFLRFYSPFLPVARYSHFTREFYIDIKNSVTYISAIDVPYISRPDDLQLSRKSIQNLSAMKVLQNLETIAIDYSEIRLFVNSSKYSRRKARLNLFPNLKTIILAIGSAWEMIEYDAEVVIKNPTIPPFVYTDMEKKEISDNFDKAKDILHNPLRKQEVICEARQVYRGGVFVPDDWLRRTNRIPEENSLKKYRPISLTS